MYVDVEYIYEVPGDVDLEIPGAVALGFYSDICPEVPGKVPILVPVDVALGITDIFASVFPGVVSLGYAIWVPGKVFL